MLRTNENPVVSSQRWHPFRRGRPNCRQDAMLACRSQDANGLTLLPCYLAVSGKAPNCTGLARKKSSCCQLGGLSKGYFAKPTKKWRKKGAQSFLKHLACANRPFAFTRSLPLCHQRHRIRTDYDLRNNRVKGGFEVNEGKNPIAYCNSSSPKSNQSEVTLADSILNVAPSKMEFHSLQQTATSKRPGSEAAAVIVRQTGIREGGLISRVTLQDAWTLLYGISIMESEIEARHIPRISTTDLAVSHG